MKVASALLHCQRVSGLPQSPDVLMGNMGLNGPWHIPSWSGSEAGWPRGLASLSLWWAGIPGASKCLPLDEALWDFLAFDPLLPEEEPLLVLVVPWEVAGLEGERAV